MLAKLTNIKFGQNTPINSFLNEDRGGCLRIWGMLSLGKETISGHTSETAASGHMLYTHTHTHIWYQTQISGVNFGLIVLVILKVIFVSKHLVKRYDFPVYQAADTQKIF